MKSYELIKTYVDGWRKNDVGKILSVLTDDVIIIESHGPMYRGRVQVKRWITRWIESKSKVTEWKITSFYLSKDNRMAFFEWNFACFADVKHHAFLGISLVKFTRNRISFIHEYRMTSH